MNLNPLEILFMEGDPGDRMYIIRKGKIRILKREGSQMATLAELGPGSILGEMSLLDNQPRSATAKTLEYTEVAEIDQKMLEATYAALPPWLTSIIRMVVQRLRETTGRKYKDDFEHSLPCVLFLLDSASQLHPLHTDFSWEPLAEKARGMYGIVTSDFQKLLEVLHNLQAIQLQGNLVRVEDPLLLNDLYSVQLDRGTPKPDRAKELSPKELGLAETILRMPQEVTGKLSWIPYPELPANNETLLELTKKQLIRWSPALEGDKAPTKDHKVTFEQDNLRRMVKLNQILQKIDAGF